MEKIMFVAIAFIIVYVILYRKNKGEKFSAYVTEQIGQEYPPKQYAMQVAIFGIGFSVLG